MRRQAGGSAEMQTWIVGCTVQACKPVQAARRTTTVDEITRD